ncbi:MAG: YdeI/OmpD-associated family protein [Acidobacteria bacterium]|nr:YdeI/OmpD-associated family protein [Acidobacteriota bacterium]
MHRIYINTHTRRIAGIDVGDRVRLSLQYDPAPRLLPVPDELSKVLASNKRARVAWESLSPSHRKEYLSYLNALKTRESVERNVKKVMENLLKHES